MANTGASWSHVSFLFRLTTRANSFKGAFTTLFERMMGLVTKQGDLLSQDPVKVALHQLEHTLSSLKDWVRLTRLPRLVCCFPRQA